MPPNGDANGGGDGSEGDVHRCGSTDTTDGSPCAMRVSGPEETCYLHGEDGEVPDHQGRSGKNQLARRRGADGGAPEGNRNGMTHGLYAAERDPFGLFDFFREEDPAKAASIRRWFWSYMGDAPFEAYPGDADRYSPPVAEVVDVDALEAADDDQDDTVAVSQGAPRQRVAADAPPIDVEALTGKAHRLFVVCVHQAVLTAVTLEQAKALLTHEEEIVSEGSLVINPQTNEPVTIEEELPVNLPKARMRQRDLRELRDLGILDDPESELADATAGWADAARALADTTDHGDGSEADR